MFSCNWRDQTKAPFLKIAIVGDRVLVNPNDNILNKLIYCNTLKFMLKLICDWDCQQAQITTTRYKHGILNVNIVQQKTNHTSRRPLVIPERHSLGPNEF